MPSIPGSLLPFNRGAGPVAVAVAGAGAGAGVDTGASLNSLYAGEYAWRPTGVWF